MLPQKENLVILHYTNRLADVYSYQKSLELIHNLPTVIGETDIDNSIMKITTLLISHESLFYDMNLDHSLIN